MTTPPSYRQLAHTALGQAAAELNSLPEGDHPTQVVAVSAARAQVIATIAMTQALLELGDVLRARLPSGEVR